MVRIFHATRVKTSPAGAETNARGEPPTTQYFDFEASERGPGVFRVGKLSLIFAVSAVLLGIVLVGCNEAKTGDMVGTWNLTAASRRYLPPDMANISPRLVLTADGRFTTTDLPGEFHGSLDVVERFSGTGSWTFITKDGRQQIQLNPDDAYGTQFEIANDGGVWKLRYFLGDPDEHRRLEYAKSGTPTQYQGSAASRIMKPPTFRFHET